MCMVGITGWSGTLIPKMDIRGIVQTKDVVPSNVKSYDHRQSGQIVRISDPIQNRNHFMTGPLFESQLFCLTVGLVFESHQFMFSLQCYLQIKIVNPQQRC